MEDCIALARALGKKVGDELKIPVYLYERAATTPSRENLADVRRGEFVGILSTESWRALAEVCRNLQLVSGCFCQRPCGTVCPPSSTKMATRRCTVLRRY